MGNTLSRLKILCSSCALDCNELHSVFICLTSSILKMKKLQKIITCTMHAIELIHIQIYRYKTVLKN